MLYHRFLRFSCGDFKVVCLLFALLLGGTLLAPNRCSAEESKSTPLNVVLLLADDLRWDALGFAGNPVVQTPHLDALARDGVAFSNAFCTTSICATSRASILTGQYARRHGAWRFDTNLTPAAFAETFPGMLRKAGYRTGFVGKWGVGNEMPKEQFDYWAGFPGQGRYFAANDKERKNHLHERISSQAAEFLGGCEADQPFCLQVSFKTPHAQDGERQEYPAEARYDDLYAEVEMPRPPAATEKHFSQLPEFLQTSEGRRRWQPRFSTPALFQQRVKDYYRLVTGMDRVVGEIVADLRKRGMLERTLIVFTSDNGYFLGDYGLADKWFMQDPSIRLPLVVFDPRLPPEQRGRKVEQLALNIDVAPTLLSAAGLNPPEAMQGRSLLPLVRGEMPNWREEFFYEHLFEHAGIPKTEGVRGQRWKYVRYLVEPQPVEQLFDLKNDPLEEQNLAADPQHAKTLAVYRQRWEEMRGAVQ